MGRAMYLLLRTIDDTDGAVCQQSIADRIGLTKGAVSRHVAAAQRPGWLVLAASPVPRRENAGICPEGGTVHAWSLREPVRYAAALRPLRERPHG